MPSVTTVAAITAICYLIGLVAKAAPVDDKFIPSLCGLAGGALGAAGLYLMPGFPAEDLLTAIAVGIASGLAATGLNEAAKQLMGK